MISTHPSLVAGWSPSTFKPNRVGSSWGLDLDLRFASSLSCSCEVSWLISRSFETSACCSEGARVFPPPGLESALPFQNWKRFDGGMTNQPEMSPISSPYSSIPRRSNIIVDVSGFKIVTGVGDAHWRGTRPWFCMHRAATETCRQQISTGGPRLDKRRL